MPSSNTRATARRLAIASALALATTTLPVTPAQAAVFTYAELEVDADVHDDSGCSENPGAVLTEDPDQTLVENGPTVTVAGSASGSVTDGAADTQTGSASVSATGSVASTGSNLKSVSLTAQGSTSVTNTVADSACQVHVYASVDLNFEFVVSQPGFLTFTRSVRGSGVPTEFVIYQGSEGGPYHDTYGEGLELDSTEVIYLEAGPYFGRFNATGGDSTNQAIAGSGKATMRATFSPAGSQTVASAGKGKKYVTLGAAGRSCAADTLTAFVTSKAKRAAQITQLKVFVNGKSAKTVKKPKKGDAVVLTGIADSADAVVKVVASLAKKANGKPRKPAEVTASYEACSPSP